MLQTVVNILNSTNIVN